MTLLVYTRGEVGVGRRVSRSWRGSGGSSLLITDPPNELFVDAHGNTRREMRYS